MEHKGNKWLGKTSQFKKRKKHRKDKEMIFDNSVIAEEESDYVIQDEEGNIIHPDNRMARICPCQVKSKKYRRPKIPQNPGLP